VRLFRTPSGLCWVSRFPQHQSRFLLGPRIVLFFSGGCTIQSAHVLELQSKLFSICCRYFPPGLSLRYCVVIFLVGDSPAAGFYSSRRSNLFHAMQVAPVLVCAQERAVSCGESAAPLNFSACLLGFGQSCASARFKVQSWIVASLRIVIFAVLLLLSCSRSCS
jgi:hypothetical protein